jgi:hypothetical protein
MFCVTVTNKPFTLRVVMPNVIILSAIMLTVMAPSRYAQKYYMRLTPGPNVIKLFTAIIYECS